MTTLRLYLSCVYVATMWESAIGLIELLGRTTRMADGRQSKYVCVEVGRMKKRAVHVPPTNSTQTTCNFRTNARPTVTERGRDAQGGC